MLVVEAGLVFATSAVFARVGSAVWNRPAPRGSTRIPRIFALWWFALAAFLAANGGFFVAGEITTISPELVTTTSIALAAILCFGLSCVLSYVSFLVTGRRRAMKLAAAYYALAFVWTLYVLMSSDSPLNAGTSMRVDIAPDGNIVRGLAAVLFVPQLLGGIAFGAIYFRVKHRALRYRIGLIAAALGLIALAIALAPSVHLAPAEWWFASRVATLASALAALGAYSPPAIVRRWLAEPAVAPEATRL